MSFAPDILDPKDLQKRIAEAATRRDDSRRHLLPAKPLKATTCLEMDAGHATGWCEEISYLRCSVQLALLENANGAAATRFRDILREGIVTFEPAAQLEDS